jgi:hypothetical protein
MLSAHKNKLKIIVGVIAWLAVCIFAFAYGRSGTSGDSLLPRLAGYFGKQPKTVELYSNENHELGFGDPVFLVEGDDVIRVGSVAFIDFGKGFEDYKVGDTKIADVKLFGRCPPLEDGDYMMVHATDLSMDWVVRTMLPPESRARISKMIVDAWQANEKDLVALFKPLIEESLTEAGEIIREELQVAIANHKPEIESISARFKDQLVQKEIIPLVKSEIWPIVQEEAQPLAEKIGREVWREVSVWRFGWRYLYDRSPLPDKQLTEKEFNRFVENKAVPILENHVDDFVDVQEQILSRVSNNSVVKETVSKSVQKVASDPEFRELVATLIREVLVDNQRLRDAIEAKWRTPKARFALSKANMKLDPTIIEIGRSMFGSTETAITPEFARVLRNRILHKDERWLTLHTKSAGSRDEELASIILSEKNVSLRGKDGIRRLPMIEALDDSEYPVPAAPPVDFQPELGKASKPK